MTLKEHVWQMVDLNLQVGMASENVVQSLNALRTHEGAKPHVYSKGRVMHVVKSPAFENRRHCPILRSFLETTLKLEDDLASFSCLLLATHIQACHVSHPARNAQIAVLSLEPAAMGLVVVELHQGTGPVLFPLPNRRIALHQNRRIAIALHQSPGRGTTTEDVDQPMQTVTVRKAMDLKIPETGNASSMKRLLRFFLLLHPPRSSSPHTGVFLVLIHLLTHLSSRPQEK